MFFTNSVDVDPGIAVLELVSTGDQDFFIQKLNSDGTLAWVKSFGGPYIDQINDISIDSQGNLIGCGVFYDSIIFDSSVPTAYSSGLSDIFIIKLDLNGNFMWVKTYGSPNLETAYTLDLDTMDNIYLTGHFKTPLDFNPGTGYDSLYTFHRTPFIHKLDSDGNHLWAKQIENVTSGDGRGRCIEIDQNNEILVAGVFRSTFDFDPGPA
ncbi:MAG: hypothetical protein IPG07_12695 [Crocinitomicaceae bacterium]|nr:hypothetical protein [Crocinitomicaceae bacterium]